MRKNKQSPVVFAKKPTLVATQVALAVMAQVAYAQQPVQTAERVERVEITGSRIPTVEAEGPSPVTVMTAVLASGFSGSSVADRCHPMRRSKKKPGSDPGPFA